MTQRHSAFWLGEVSPLLPLIIGDGSRKFAVAEAIRQQIGGYHAGHGTKDSFILMRAFLILNELN